MNEDSWLVSKQAQFLRDEIKSLHISVELMECLTILTKQVLTQTEKIELVKRFPSVPRLAGRALELIRQSQEMLGTLEKESHELDALSKKNLPSSTSQPLSELDYDKPIVKPLRDKRTGTLAIGIMLLILVASQYAHTVNASSPNGLLQVQNAHSPNVDVTLPCVTIFIRMCYCW